jgi:hypothetical protein
VERPWPTDTAYMDVATPRRKDASGSRTPFPILIATAIDIAFAATPLVQLVRREPALRGVIWPDLIARTAMALVPAVFALVALLRRSRLALDAAVVLNVLVLVYAVPASGEFVFVPLVPVILLLFGRSRMQEDDGGRPARIAVGIAVLLSAIATVVFLTAPMRHVLWSTQTRAGRVVESHVQIQGSCPATLGEVIAPANDGGESGCDPVPLPSRTEPAIALWGMALVIGLGGVVRRGTSEPHTVRM